MIDLWNDRGIFAMKSKIALAQMQKLSKDDERRCLTSVGTRAIVAKIVGGRISGSLVI